MALSLILACVWVIAAAIVSMLPMRFQYLPGVTLLILAIPLAVFVAMEVGVLWVLAVIFAVLSMFRRPLYYIARRLVARVRGKV
ncbi:MAG: DUF2484 family protein [Rhodobacteraceae bacterium]|jgi:hypothetical protein|nr:DUF2484 family protein [Paracoccaceae bacterium]